MTKEEIIKEFKIEEKELNECEIIFAIHHINGKIYILFNKKGSFYEVEASTYFSNDLEGKWEPERISLDYLSYVVTQLSFHQIYKKELIEAVNNHTESFPRWEHDDKDEK